MYKNYWKTAKIFLFFVAIFFSSIRAFSAEVPDLCIHKNQANEKWEIRENKPDLVAYGRDVIVEGHKIYEVKVCSLTPQPIFKVLTDVPKANQAITEQIVGVVGENGVHYIVHTFKAAPGVAPRQAVYKITPADVSLNSQTGFAQISFNGINPSDLPDGSGPVLPKGLEKPKKLSTARGHFAYQAICDNTGCGTTKIESQFYLNLELPGWLQPLVAGTVAKRAVAAGVALTRRLGEPADSKIWLRLVKEYPQLQHMKNILTKRAVPNS